jgi:hypothetical protein
MPRDLNDIIPPSRRKSMGDMVPMQSAPSAPPRMDDIPYTRPAPIEETLPHEESHELFENSAVISKSTPIRVPRHFPIGTALLALGIIAACGLVFYSFSGAKVVVSPVMSPATVATDLIAYADKGDLTFRIVSVEKTATADIKASGVSNVSEAAHGSIVIHNAQSTKQQLIKNTRFQTADGLTFRIHDSISVPAGGDTTVDVFADEAGDKYNVALTTFTIPGLKGSPAFTQVTAKSVAAMTGGFVGQKATAPQDVKDKTYASMQAQLTTDLQKDITAKIPEGYVLIQGATYPTYTPGPDTAKGADTVTLSEKGSIQAVVFPEGALARAIAFKSIGTYDGSDVTFASVDGLTLKPVEASLAPDVTEYTFNVAGNTTVVWHIDTDKIAGAVAGKTRDSAEIALKSFLEVEKATLVLRPFWSHSFPADPKKIQVVVQKATDAK